MESNENKLIPDSFANIRNTLSTFKSGNICLEKNQETGIATICLDHLEKRNAMNGGMMVQLRDCIGDLENWKEGKGVVIYGKGDNFCSGGDLDFAKTTSNPQQGLNMSIWMVDAMERLHKLPLISVCIAQGPTLGGGAEISLFCDFIVVADDVKYGFLQAKMGIPPAWGGGVKLMKKIGYNKALDLFLTAKILNAKECVDIGIAETIVSSKQSLDETIKWLSLRLPHHYSVIHGIKKALINANDNTYENALKLEKFIFAPFWGGEINKKAVEKQEKHIKR